MAIGSVAGPKDIGALLKPLKETVASSVPLNAMILRSVLLPALLLAGAAFHGRSSFCADAATAVVPPTDLGYSTIAQAHNALTEPLKDGRAETGQHDAFYFLVASGPDGWRLLLERLADPTGLGDTARKIDSFWGAGGIPAETVDEFIRFRIAELNKRARANESWALMFAAAYARTEHHGRRETFVDRVDARFKAVRKSRQHPAQALVEIAFLRVSLVSDEKFPGHRFPWAASADQQKEAITNLLAWWKSNRKRYVEQEN
jgi:hypothetical protein